MLNQWLAHNGDKSVPINDHCNCFCDNSLINKTLIINKSVPNVRKPPTVSRQLRIVFHTFGPQRQHITLNAALQ